MKLRTALAAIALLTLAQGCASSGAKDGNLARCNGNAKRDANPYGTVLPTIPPRDGVTSSNGDAPQGPTNLFPSGARAAPASETTVPAISAVAPGAARLAALPVTYGSC